MPLIRKTASDVTNYVRVNAISVSPVAPNLRRPATYAYSPRQVIPPITRASLAGAAASPSTTVLKTYGGVYSPYIPRVEGPITGSIEFPTDAESIVFAPLAGNPFALGTGDFTIEWWQYLDTPDSNTQPAVFELPDTGGLLAISVVLSLDTEGYDVPRRVVLIYFDAFSLSYYISGTLGTDNAFPMSQQWAHLALVRESGEFRFYFNGTLAFSSPNTVNITSDGTGLRLGGQGSGGFEGLLTNFNWVVGTALYNRNFVPPNGNVPVDPSAVLLLRAATAPTFLDNSASTSLTVTNNGTNWSSSKP